MPLEAPLIEGQMIGKWEDIPSDDENGSEDARCTIYLQLVNKWI